MTSIREAVYEAVRKNPAGRTDDDGKPCLEDMDSLDSVALIVEMEKATGERITDEEAQAFLGSEFSSEAHQNRGYTGSLSPRDVEAFATYLTARKQAKTTYEEGER